MVEEIDIESGEGGAVIKQYKNNRHLNYRNSGSEKAFDKMKVIFDDLSSTKQQDESKKIVTAACYYLTGDKLAEKLFEQRKKLRTLQNDFTDIGQSDAVPEALSVIAEWRQIFFSGKPYGAQSIEPNLQNLNTQKIDQVKVYCDLLSSSKTILVIPPLARAWNVGRKRGDHSYFFQNRLLLS